MPEITECPKCGRKLKIPETLLGKSVKCPGCQKVFLAGSGGGAEADEHEEEEVPQARRRAVEPEAEEEEARPRKKRPIPDDDDEEDDDEEEERPRRKRPRRGGRRSAALASVSGPAIALMVAGILGIVLVLANAVFMLTGGGDFMMGQGKQVQVDPAFETGRTIGRIVGVVLGLCWGGIVLTGALRMKSLQSYGFAMTGAIVAMLPCNGCCLLGIPFGIWALVVLNKPEVKSSFE